MPTYIRATRAEINRSFPAAGFTIHSGTGSGWYEVALATDPKLFHSESKSERTLANFYSTHALGPLPVERGEAVYLVPPDVLARFVGRDRLYYTLATFATPDRRTPQVALPPPEATPFITVSRSFTGQPRRQLIGVSNSRGGAIGDHAGYGTATGDALIWAGDAATPGASEPIPAAPAAGAQTAPTHTATVSSKPAASTPAAVAAGYDDGFDQDFWRGLALEVAADDSNSNLDAGDIDGPIPDGGTTASAMATVARTLDATDYPHASRFVPAASSNFRHSASGRAIRQVVIHITDGGANIGGPISWFQNPSAHVSAHYIVGQDGEVVQMVHDNDVAWHAGRANGDSIGIEHVANTRGLMPTDTEYCASAALVAWLCQQYGIPADRDHIRGHSEADPGTHHTGCPNAVWQWDQFMNLVTNGGCDSSSQTAQPVATGQSIALAQAGHSRNGHSSGAVVHPVARAVTERHTRAHALGVVAPMDVPSDPAQAAAFMADWLRRRAAWTAGVTDTSVFPHSAICHLRMTFPDGAYTGTGFYIANDRILTCGHNVVDFPSGSAVDATAITVTPGMNGAGTAPFGSFSISRSDWDYHPRYDGTTHDFDLAVLRVSTPPPNGQFFDILEELNESRNSPIIVCGYAGHTSDRYKQHLDGDMVRTLGASGETLQYNLQTERGASGSPVFYVWGYEDEQRQQSVTDIRVIGVHVAGAGATLNEACRLTQDKINWIQHAGVPASFGMGVRGVAAELALMPFAADDVDRMRQEFVSNAQSGAARRDCITISNAGLRQLFGTRLKNADGTNRALGSTVQDTMGALTGYGLAQPPRIFEFVDASGRTTRGVVRPDHLGDSVEAWLMSQAEAMAMSGWYIFGLSLMDGYHSVVLGLQFSGTGNAATRVYWADQIYNGWDDVTGNLDARITSRIQAWWDPLPPDHKARTRVTVWPLQP